MSEFREILGSVDNEGPLVGEMLFQLVYDELRQLAAARLANESAGQTLQPTALVHEVYLRLTAGQNAPEWENKRHFFAAAAEAMRRILIDRARHKLACKRGAAIKRLELDEGIAIDDGRSSQLVALSEALDQLERHDKQAAELVKLRYFAGMSHQDAAAALQISRRAADRMWALARAWLYQKLSAE